MGVRSWCALSVQFCCRTAKTFVVSLTDFYLSANNTCSLEWSRLSLLPASHPVHTDPIQLTPQPDAPPPTTLVCVPQSLDVIHEDSRDTWRLSLLQGRQQLPPQPKHHHDPQKREVQALQTVKGAVARRVGVRLANELGQFSSRRGPFIFALCVTRVVWEAFVRTGKSLPS